MTAKLLALRVLHRVAIAASCFAMFFNLRTLWEWGGGLECWCDEAQAE